MSDFKPYLQSAHIEGYKSIVNCDVTFKPGLNIIIGKNGTGKTNLLEALKLAVEARPYNLKKEPHFSSTIFLNDRLSSGKSYKVRIEKVRFQSPPALEVPPVDLRADVNRIVAERKIGDLGEFQKMDWIVEELFVQTWLFPLASMKKIPFFNNRDAGWRIRGDYSEVIDNDYSEGGLDGAIPSLQRMIEFLLGETSIINPDQNVKRVDLIRKVIVDAMLDFRSRILPAVKSSTPITDMRIWEGQITNGILENSLEITGFRFEFEVDGQFHSFDNLSDGTKRVLQIAIDIAETIYQTAQTKYNLKIYMIEEPELGIHPHQLQLLMNFLKEQSQKKQIIITTHSPQVLDILNKDELDRIIIASFDPRKGSQFRNLTDKEIGDAQNFMSDMYLSDYWRFSDLEGEKVR